MFQKKFNNTFKTAVTDHVKESRRLAEDRKRNAEQAANLKLASVFNKKIEKPFLVVLEQP